MRRFWYIRFYVPLLPVRFSEAFGLLLPAGWDANTPARWADLGCGTGRFTEALARLLPPRSVIHAVDTDAAAMFQIPNVPDRHLSRVVADFTAFPWTFAPGLDGLLMANSLHYVEDQRDFLENAVSYLRPGGRVLLVEYDATVGTPWVPHPLPFAGVAPLFATVGYHRVRKLGEQPSRYRNGNLYAALVEP